ncbi:MAG: ComEC/Rec2 family competence protein [Candidatus Paceibacterota bacterium]
MKRTLPILILLLLLNFFVWTAGLQSGNLVVTFFDIGQGDSILIETPEGYQVLVDGGPDTSILRELGSELSFFDRSLDMIIVTHPDQDHIGGFPEVFARYDIEHVLASSGVSDSETANTLLQRMEEEGAIIFPAEVGQVIELGDAVTLTVLYPDISAQSRSVNDASTVIRLEYGETSMLLTGDIEAGVESYLLSSSGVAELLDVDVLKAAHHGSDSSSSLPFLSAVSPEYVVIQAGAGNRYGHPHSEVLERLSLFSEDVWCTCDEGRIVLESDGERWIR